MKKRDVARAAHNTADALCEIVIGRLMGGPGTPTYLMDELENILTNAMWEHKDEIAAALKAIDKECEGIWT